MSILNGRYGQDEGVGSFIFRDHSVIDDAITSRRGLTLLSDFEIQDSDRIYSDGHCLLQITLHFATQSSKNNIKIPQHSPELRKWDQQKATNISENIDEAVIRDIDSLESRVLQQHIDEVALKITELFEQTAEKKTFTKEFCLYSNTSNENKPWFGYRCKKKPNCYITEQENDTRIA